MKLTNLLAVAVALGLSAVAMGQRNDLKVGDQAPGLDIQEWVKGDAVSIETGNVYIVEFWATWCGPCLKAIPHLTELQHEFADDGLTIIGVSNEETGVVKPFVKKQGKKMDYTVAVDRRDSTNRAWFKAAGLRGIPASFIVDRKGKIAYIGNPHAPEFEETLRQVMRGRFDPELSRQAAPAIKAARENRAVRNWRVAEMQYDKVIGLDPEIFADIALERFHMMLVDKNEKLEAYRYARNDLIKGMFANDPGALRMLAEKIALDPDIEDGLRDLTVAQAAAEASVRREGDSPIALSTLAMVLFQQNDVDEAIRLQKKAWFNAKPKRKAEYRRVLTAYQETANDRADSN